MVNKPKTQRSITKDRQYTVQLYPTVEGGFYAKTISVTVMEKKYSEDRFVYHILN